MSSPKFVRNYKSPRNNSGKHQDPKPLNKKAQKSKDPVDKQKKQKQQFKIRYQQMEQRCKDLQNMLRKERQTNQNLQLQIKQLVQQLSKCTQKKGKDKQDRQKHEVGFDSATKYSSVSKQKQQGQKITQKRQYQTQYYEQSVSSFQPESPKQKIQVGGYFGSLFN